MPLQLLPDPDEQVVWPSPNEVRRMAAFARRRGVRLAFRHRQPVVIDPRDAEPHHVTGFSCDCAFFARCGGCQHHSLVLDALGWIPEAVIDPNAAAPSPGAEDGPVA